MWNLVQNHQTKLESDLEVMIKNGVLEALLTSECATPIALVQKKMVEYRPVGTLS